MAQKTTVQLTTGAAGTGKSYARCPRYLVDDFLPDYEGNHWSNFPINVDSLAELAYKKRGLDVEQTKSRIHIIPPEVLRTWETPVVDADGNETVSGPWDFFADKDLDQTHIAIDEIHVYCGRNHSKAVKAQWQKWLGDIRHAGATVEFLSQNPMKIAKEIDYEAAVRLEFVSAAHRRDPLFKIPVGDWYELLAAVRRKWHETVIAHEFRQEKGRWKLEHTYKWRLDPSYFPAYDSFNKTREDGKSGKQALKQYEKRSIGGVFLWFALRHPVSLTVWSLFIVFVFYLLSGGGGTLMNFAFSHVTKAFVPSGDKTPRQVDAQASPQEPITNADHSSKLEIAPTTQPSVIPPETIQEIEELKAQVKQANKRDLESWSVTMLLPDEVTFRDGYTYRVGELIDYGPFANHTIESIEYEKRTVNLSGDVILRMGRANRMPPAKSPDDATEDTDSAGIHGPLQPPEAAKPPKR